MKKTLILGMAAAGLALSSLTAFATQDEKYPAASFEPQVVYIDKDAVKAAPAASAPTAPDAKYPAAAFQPKVVFIDENAASAAAKKPEVKVVHDPKYPAAYFQPKVIYP